MPLREEKSAAHDLGRSLGWLAVWFIETFVRRGRGDAEGQPVQLTREETEFIVSCYCLDLSGRRLYDHVMFSRTKGWAKSEKAAFIALFEAVGPCRIMHDSFGAPVFAKGDETFEFLGEVYPYHPGEPMGRFQKSPFIRVMATEEKQAGEVYDTIRRNFDTGPLSELKAMGLDAGTTRVLLPQPWDGEIRPSTSGSASKDGGKETFAVVDESHRYITNELRGMYQTVSQNLPKRGKVAEPWLLETTTMFAPGEFSIAEITFQQADKIHEGKVKRSRLYFNHRWGHIDEADLGDEDLLAEAVREAYGDALEWNDVDSIIDKIYDPQIPVANSMRFYLNEATAAADAWVTPQQLEAIETDADVFDEHGVDAWKYLIAEGEQITLGFDGSLRNDATALVGCRVSDGLLFPIRIDEAPDGPEARNWEVDQTAFDAAVEEAFERFDVVGFFADPPYWQDWLDKWERDHGGVLKAKVGRELIRFWTSRLNQMANALERLHTAIVTKNVPLLGDPRLLRHMANGRVRMRREGALVFKEYRGSPKKIDALMAATLAYEARARLLGEGAHEEHDPFDLPFRMAG